MALTSVGLALIFYQLSGFLERREKKKRKRKRKRKEKKGCKYTQFFSQ
jgi:hypothetical protein